MCRIPMCWSLLACLIFAVRPSHAAETGTITKTFTERSPLSSIKEMQTRWRQKKLEPDYDLSSQPFLLCVPAKYDSARPPGVFLLMNYKNTVEPAEVVRAFLAEHNLIFASAVNSNQPPWVKCGLCLDAIHGLQKDYRIDNRRIYLFDFSNEGGGEDWRCSFRR